MLLILVFVSVILVYLSSFYYDFYADSYTLLLFVFDWRISVFTSEFKLFMIWKSCFPTTLSFPLKIASTYSLMFDWLTAGYYMIACLVDYVVTITYFGLKATPILFIFIFGIEGSYPW